MLSSSRAAIALALAAGLAMSIGTTAQAQETPPPGVTVENGSVQLDFNDVELSVVIDTIAQLTGQNFIYDDRVRGRVTIVSPNKISREEAYAVFESVLQVKGFTTVKTPGGAIKVIPIREAKESNVETVRGRSAVPKSDRFITRLIPLRFIDAEAITNTVKPLVSKDASMVAYAPTNTVILTDSASNISRILSILTAIDVETYKEELTVIQVRHADASSLASQLSEIFDADVSSASAAPARPRARRAANATADITPSASKGRVRLITDERTNSLLVLASRQRIAEIRDVVQRLDVPVIGGGRIHVYYLKHADAEELAQTLSGLIGGQPAAAAAPGGNRGARGGVANPALRAAITELADGVTVTADAPTNSLVIQATKDGFNTLSQVIQQLDIPRPQVLVEALIMEVDVTDNETLGFNGLARIFRGNTSYAVGSLTGTGRGAVVGSFPTAPTTTTTPGGDGEDDATTTTTTAVDGFTGSASEVIGDLAGTALGGLVAAASRNTLAFDPVTGAIAGGSLIQGLINATADLGGTNILSAPHILTVDNEEAEIKVGNNIPIVTSRVESAAGQDTGLATSQNIERQDIGITLRVTPQISEGDNLRLQIFQEITNVNEGLSAVTGDPQEVGVALSNRTIQNTVVVGDNETVVIGGLISDNYSDTESKVPWIGDIPILGWAFKTVTKRATKENLLVFLTPRIVRNEQQLAAATIRKREEFWDTSEGALRLTKKEKEAAKTRRQEAINAGIPLSTYRGRNPVRGRLVEHRDRYPVDQMLEIERREEAREQEVNAARAEIDAMRFGILAATFGDEGAAASTLQQLIDAGYDGSMVAEDRSGTVLYQVHLGPFQDRQQAEAAAEVLRATFELAPTVTLESDE